eukprot:58853_1
MEMSVNGSSTVYIILLILSYHIINAQFDGIKEEEICVKSSKVSLDGTYQWSYWNADINGSVYYNSDTNLSIYPFIRTDGHYRYYIGSNTSSTWVKAYCVLNNNSTDYIFNINDCVRNWKIFTTGDSRSSFVRDANMVVTGCQNICVSANNYSAVDGMYIFSHFDFANNGSVYYCASCAAFLYPIISEDNFYWKVGFDYTTLSAQSSCNLGDRSNGYIFTLDDCIGSWKSYHSSKDQWLPSSVLTQPCNYPDFNTTSTTIPLDNQEDEFPLFDIILAVLCCFILLSSVCWLWYKKKKKDRKLTDKVTWDAVFDFNNIRSNFKSTESLQAYLSHQSWSIEMIVSLTFLVIAIFINTYTNYHSFLHYRHQSIADEFSPALLLDNGGAFFATVECSLSFTLILMTFVYYINGNYTESVASWIGWVPNVSAMVYFLFLNTNVAKMLICEAWNSKKTLIGKLLSTTTWISGLLLMVLVGVWIFVIKVQQISYIYDRDFETLDRWDFLVVLGVARQFAGLCSYGEIPYFDWAFQTIHPEKAKALKQIDFKWKKKNDMDSIVCAEMIEQYGFWGYCWLCYTFSNENNVKKLYLVYNDEQGSMADPTAYVQMVDKY